MSKTVYIAGKMRGTPDLGRGQFNAAEKNLREMGFRVLNPAILPTDLDNTAYMPICFEMLREADVVLMLDGWHDARTTKPPCDEYYHVYMRNDLWDESGDKYIVTVAYYDGDWDAEEKPYIAYWREIDEPKPPTNFKPF